MCGIFGYITKNGRGPDLASLRRIATETEHLGRHAFGLAWIDRDGDIHVFKRPGAATDDLDDLNACRGAQAVIGHCRWATHGDPQDNRNNHPHTAGRGWIVHNGVVHNYQDLIRQYGFIPKTQCDSEILGMIMAQSPGTLGQRAIRTTKLAMGTLAILGLWSTPTRLLIVRNGRPLHFGETSNGVYFSSISDELSDLTMPVADQYASVLTFDNRRLYYQGYEIKKRTSQYFTTTESTALPPRLLRLFYQQNDTNAVNAGGTYCIKEREF